MAGRPGSNPCVPGASLAMAFLAARALSTYGPERTTPAGFLGSAALLLAEWSLTGLWPRGAAVFV